MSRRAVTGGGGRVITQKVPHILYGGDYNAEQWPEEVWREDARLMREAGVNLVTVGVFSWALLESRPGEYDFGWLDRVMDLLHEHGIHVDLATGTASPPPWLAQRHPESLPVTADGVTLWPGGRQQYCPSSAAYREAAEALVRRLAERYRGHPALALWHVNNEYGCHVAECYCDVSAAAFREWLRRRYGSIEALNEAWGTAFWSQRYATWDEINPPRRAPTFSNPTEQLDFRRFSSDALLALFEMERAVLKEVTPDVPVTTNFMGFFKPADYWRWAAREDVVADDSYPDPADPRAHVAAAMRCDLMRSLAGERPWMLMEQAPSQVNWRARNVPKRPGQMRLWSLQAVARGAEGVMFFQWRASRAGAEKFHSGMVPHAGAESRTFREVAALGAELRRLDAVQGARVPAEVAIVFDWESWWALELDSHPSADLRQLDQVSCYYEPLYARNVAMDFVPPDADLTRYRLVLVPSLYLVREGVAGNLERYVRGGGTLVMSFFSGIVDARDHVPPGAYPAPFRELLGMRVEEFAPHAEGQSNGIVDTEGRRYACELWSDVIEPEGAESLATFAEEFYAGRPAVTRHRFGRGRSYYLGTRPERAYMDTLLARACDESGVRPPLEAPDGVEVVRRVAGADSFLFALNHTAHAVELARPGAARDLLADRPRRGRIRLEPLGVAVLRER
jgi:beta-galactosidase